MTRRRLMMTRRDALAITAKASVLIGRLVDTRLYDSREDGHDILRRILEDIDSIHMDLVHQEDWK